MPKNVLVLGDNIIYNGDSEALRISNGACLRVGDGNSMNTDIVVGKVNVTKESVSQGGTASILVGTNFSVHCEENLLGATGATAQHAVNVVVTFSSELYAVPFVTCSIDGTIVADLNNNPTDSISFKVTPIEITTTYVKFCIMKRPYELSTSAISYGTNPALWPGYWYNGQAQSFSFLCIATR